MRTNIWSD